MKSKYRSRFWSWLFRTAKKKVQETHLDQHHNDIKCHGCKEWFSVTSVEYNHKSIGVKDEALFAAKCGKCDTLSVWLMDVPTPIRLEEYSRQDVLIGGDKMDPLLFEKGDLCGVYDMPKDQAEAMCAELTASTGMVHDWHYSMGRVCVKRLSPTE